MKRCNTRSGFTIIEVMIASAVLIAGLAGIIALLGQANLTHGQMVDESRASMLADEVLADIEANYETRWRDRRRDGVPDALERLPNRRGPFQGAPADGAMQYAVTYTYRRVDYRGKPAAAVTPSATDLREVFVRVEVYYDGAGGEKTWVSQRVLFLSGFGD